MQLINKVLKVVRKYFDLSSMDTKLYRKRFVESITSDYITYFPCPIECGGMCHDWIKGKEPSQTPDGNCHSCIFGVVPGCDKVQQYRRELSNIRKENNLPSPRWE